MSDAPDAALMTDPCPDCGEPIPVTVKVAVMGPDGYITLTPDLTDVEAHQLSHD